METVRVKIDFVTSDSDGRSWKLILVEGPWNPPDSPVQLALLAKRISNTIEAALTGQIAARYPDSAGHAMTIQVDSYDTPRQQVDALIAQARARVEASADIQAQFKRREFVSALEFEHNWFDWQEEFDKREGPRKRGILRRIRSWFGLSTLGVHRLRRLHRLWLATPRRSKTGAGVGRATTRSSEPIKICGSLDRVVARPTSGLRPRAWRAGLANAFAFNLWNR